MAIASSSRTESPARRATLTHPALHLDSFSSLDFGNFASDLADQDRDMGRDIPEPGSSSGLGRHASSPASEVYSGDRRGSIGVGSHGGLREPNSSRAPPRRGTTGSSSNSSPLKPPTRRQGSIPPPLALPTMPLPPLPMLSPGSPLRTPYTLDTPPPLHPSGPSDLNGQTASSSQSRPLAPILSISISQPSPIVSIRDSPGVARRRTIVENAQGFGSAGLAVDVHDPSHGLRSVSESSRPASMREQNVRTDSKASNYEPKHSAPPSPTTKRSLPRVPEPATAPALMPPTASSSWPQPSPQPQQRRSSAPFVPPQQSNRSASSLAIVGGLADAGPYPSTQRMSGISGVGLGRPTTQLGPPRPPPGEEVCLECMMRDKDLADVNVSGPGAWDRQSDADWNDLKWREESLLKSAGSSRGDARGSYIEDSLSTDTESTSGSYVSTGNPLEDAEIRRHMAAQKQRRSILRAHKRDLDARISQEVGWRGFKWEEGIDGEGLPRSFRGTRGGPTSESAIKAVMTKYPKASEHRYEYLHRYLRHQWLLVMELEAEARRRGHYPGPDEMVYSDSVSSHEPVITTTPRTNSIIWEKSRMLDDKSTKSMPLPSVRPSPSTPMELASQMRVKPVAVQRPMTQVLPQGAQPVSSIQPNRGRFAKGISSPGTLERSPRMDDNLEDADDLWSPVSGGGDSALRPFSFAVRAGAAAGLDGGEGPGGRRSLWGRWGGSVTSFFGGSQGGSGSMIDMHLGLDNDRRFNTSSNQVHDYPRAVSMASPSRPSFFSRDSRSSSMDRSRMRERDSRLHKSISSSRLSQVVKSDADDEAVTPKKKGFKSFLHKMKPKSKRPSSKGEPLRPQNEQNDFGTPLRPPPNMADLAGGRKHHAREGSMSSATDTQSVNSGWRGGAYGSRSISAPLGGSNSSLSASPTSLKIRRESNNSFQAPRQSGEYEPDRRGSIVEVLAGGRPMYTSPEPGSTPDEHRYSAQQQAGLGANVPQASFRNSKHTIATMSTAPSIETPPMPVNTAPFFHGPGSPHINSPNGSGREYSPNVNRFKNLPPLPPSSSPEPMYGGLDQQTHSAVDFSQKHPAPSTQQYLSAPSGTSQPQTQTHARTYRGDPGYLYQQPLQGSATTPRSSYDPYGDRPSPRQQQQLASPRMAQSMYGQTTATGSTSSFAKFTSSRMPNAEEHASHGERKGVITKKSGMFKGFFGGARNGRLA